MPYLGHACVSLLLLASIGCATAYSPAQIDKMMGQALTAADAALRLERPVEAAQFVKLAQGVDPDYPGLVELEERVTREGADLNLFRPTLLGRNRARRYEVERSPGMRAALYLPDRLVDLLDCFTFDLNFGPTAYYKLHFTRTLQIGGGARAVVGFGTYSARSIAGASGWSGAELAFLPINVGAEANVIASAAGVRWGTRTHAGTQLPTDEYYQEFEDFWSAGFTAGLLTFGANWWVHPVQIGDFLAGWVGVDFLNDDFAHTRGLSLSTADRELLLGLSRAARSQQSLREYRATRPREDESSPRTD